MAKKSKDEVPNPSNIANREIMQRLNFMYQASVYLGAVLPSNPNSEEKRTKTKKRARKMTTHDLSKAYIASMKVVANKTMVKMDPAVKRTLCNGCNLVLVPGSTASIRVKTSHEHGHIMFYRCHSCGATRRVPAPPTGTSTDQPVASTSNVEGGMHVDESSSAPLKRNQNRNLARVPPLFARRDAGHVIFRGNDVLPIADSDGIFIT